MANSNRYNSWNFYLEKKLKKLLNYYGISKDNISSLSFKNIEKELKRIIIY